MTNSSITADTATTANRIRNLWTVYGPLITKLVIGLMVIISVGWLGYQCWRLLSPSPPIWPSSPKGAVDLLQRYSEVRHWYGRPGANTYFRLGTAVYPPATYVMFWPLSWFSGSTVRWVWFFSTLPFLGWLMMIMIRECGASSRLEKVFIGLIPLSMYATGATIGNGQPNVHIMPLLITALLGLTRDGPSWSRDLKGSALFLLSLSKPIIGGPFFWIVLFVRRSYRPALLIVATYIGLTVLAMLFKDIPFFDLIRGWIFRAAGGVAFGSTRGAVANQSTLLAGAGMQRYDLIYAAIAGVMIMGVWMYAHRRSDSWILLGVFGILTRIGIYHRWYDDLLILLPLIALYRMAKSGPEFGNRDVIAGMLFTILLFMLMAPGGLYLLPPPWNGYSLNVQTGVWMLVLCFLLWQAWKERSLPMSAQS
ncbi:MAG: DUF2029 domain-containing protein [Candidatus Latescibacteria bacterium]|nr:DUF2029 domain-containing protein [Candidatus Latescibacterota bacterium]